MFNKIIKYLKKNKHSLKAVQEQDLDKYLKSIGVYEKIQMGEIKCKFCGNIINIENLDAIIPDNGTVSIVCSNKNCLSQIYN